MSIYNGNARGSIWSSFGVLLILALAGTAPTFAQTAPATPPDEQQSTLHEVTITGSRIASPNATSTSPIQVVTDQDMLLQGVTNAGDMLSLMPQVSINNTQDLSSRNNPLSVPGGETTVDLRGLGPQRTLVLIDGQRLGPGDPNTGDTAPGADINQIPTQLIERIEIVTGGESATYGSDAIGGVVNFIMKHDFQGIQVDGQYGFYQHDNHDTYMQGLAQDSGFQTPTGSVTDGWNRNFKILAGTNFMEGQGNITGYFTYQSQNPVYQGSRDYAACLLQDTVQSQLVKPYCGGSANSNLFSAGAGTANEGDFSVVGNQLLPFPQAGSVPPGSFNSSPYETFLNQNTRALAGFMAHYDVNDAFKPYLNFNYMQDSTTVLTAPSGILYGGNPATPDGGVFVPCNSALLSASEQATLAPYCGAYNAPPGYVDLLIGRRNIEGGPRESDYVHHNYRVVLGSKGAFADAWTYDAYASEYYTNLSQLNLNYLSWTSINNALNVGPGGACLTGGAACVPYQVFTQSAVNAAQIAYLNTAAEEEGSIQERIVSASVTGDLGKYGVKSPLANEGLRVNVGLEYRRDMLDFRPDEASLSNDLSFFGGASTPIDASINVKEEFFELRAPIMQDAPFVHDSVVDVGYRHSDYSPAGPTNTYRFDVQYAPTQDVRFRSSFEHAVRAPNIVELYNPQVVTTTSVVGVDPCAGPNPTASRTACAYTGVTPGQYGNIVQCISAQCSILDGGNPNLKPETANTISVGLTFTPSFLENFQASIDWYRILLQNEISNIPISTTLSECLQTGDPSFCDLIKRSVTGGLFGTTIAGGGYIAGTDVNIASAEVRGIDVQAVYRISLATAGTLTTSLDGTYTDSNTVTPVPGLGSYNCAGLYGATCANVTPRWRHNMRMTWQMPWIDLKVSLQWRYIQSVSLDTNSSNPILNNGTYNPYYAEMPSVSYFDLSALWNVNKFVSLRAGINNILDKDPPISSAEISGTGAGNTYPTYDTLGRQIFMGVTAKF